MSTRIHSITGLRKPQGVIFIPEFNKNFVANGEDGKLEIFDGDSLELMNSIKLSDDTDNIRYATVTKYNYVGYADRALGIIDARSNKHIGGIKLERHPESFQLERPGPRIFVNIPTVNHIVEVDWEKRVVVTN
jgi:hypothetical protein